MTKLKANRKNSIKLLIKVLLGMIMLTLLWSITIGVPIRRELTALEIIFTNPDHLNVRTIVIRGWYRIGIFGQEDRFRGKIKILEYTETHESMYPLQFFTNPIGPRAGMLLYSQEDKDLPLPFAMIYSRSMFRRPLLINIRNSDGALDNFDSPMIISGVSSHENAVQTFLRFFENSADK